MVTPLGALSIIVRYSNFEIQEELEVGVDVIWWLDEFSLFIGFLYFPVFWENIEFEALPCFTFSAVLAHFLLKEKLQKMGMLGCVLCIVGSTVIVLHAPEEKTPTSIDEIWDLATQPGESSNYPNSCIDIVYIPI